VATWALARRVTTLHVAAAIAAASTVTARTALVLVKCVGITRRPRRCR
jgi:hypothetical protein